MKLLVMGDYIEDIYIFGTATRLCPEAPVPVVIPQIERTSAGGVGLVANQLRELGAQIDEWRGSWSRKQRIFCNNHLVSRIDRDSMEMITANVPALSDYDAIVVADYGKDAFSYKLARAIVDYGKPCFVDAKNHWDWYDGKNVTIFPNHVEAKPITLKEVDLRLQKIVTGKSYSAYKFGCIVNKMGEDGARLNDAEHRDFQIAAEVADVVDTTGAGDIFMASFVYAWTLQLPAEDCLRFANALAGESCRHLGTFVVGREFAQGVLDSLRASRESQPQGHATAHGSNELRLQTWLRENAVCTLTSAVTSLEGCILREGSVWDREGMIIGTYSLPIDKILQKSPSGPTRSSGVPVQWQANEEAKYVSRLSESLDRNPSDSSHQCEHTPEPDQD